MLARQLWVWGAPVFIALAALLVHAGVTSADTCNGQKAVLIGCPLEQVKCKDSGCQNGLVCEFQSTCWQTIQFYNGKFRCDPVNFAEAPQHDGKWMCYQQWTVGPLGLQPVLGLCLDVQYCKSTAFGCLADNTKPGAKYAFVYETSHDCTKPS